MFKSNARLLFLSIKCTTSEVITTIEFTSWDQQCFSLLRLSAFLRHFGFRFQLISWFLFSGPGIMSGYQSNGVAGELWLQWFGCCVTQPAQQRKRQAARRTRARIDRSMIGNPTDFQHTVHIGSGDVQMETAHLNALQHQMQSKGGYKKAFVVQVRLVLYAHSPAFFRLFQFPKTRYWSSLHGKVEDDSAWRHSALFAFPSFFPPKTE